MSTGRRRGFVGKRGVATVNDPGGHFKIKEKKGLTKTQTLGTGPLLIQKGTPSPFSSLLFLLQVVFLPASQEEERRAKLEPVVHLTIQGTRRRHALFLVKPTVKGYTFLSRRRPLV